MVKSKSKLHRGRPRTMNPEDVLQVAIRAYWHEGPEVSVNAVCQRAGVSKPSLYREFGSEDGLTAAALKQYADMILSQLRGLLSSELSFADKLEAIITFASEDPRNEHGCLFVKMRAARLHLGPKTQAKLAEIEATAVELYARFFRESRKRGEWLANFSPDFAAQYLHAQIGLAVSQRALGTETAIVRPLLECALSVLRKP
ncbi:MAG: TetR/AcrR family transcriptional regulator [Spartobacteria bacterium]|nr:TetR/AcrR family transcriptional regulator [Spartobacteria bacterium]